MFGTKVHTSDRDVAMMVVSSSVVLYDGFDSVLPRILELPVVISDAQVRFHFKQMLVQ